VFAPRAGRYLLAYLLALALGGAAVAATSATIAPMTAYAALGLWLFFAGFGLFLAVFFRDPARPAGADIVAPADGRIQLIQQEGAYLRIAVFMNVTDVHVNRFPMDARVETVSDGGAGHAPAYRPGASGNVQRAYGLSTAVGPVELVQITGILARRLVSFVRPGEGHRKGERLGMIVLGSRVDLRLPADRIEPLVNVGDRVYAGVTPVARVRS
jgi:phosphatidylserine decarboxylase